MSTIFHNCVLFGVNSTCGLLVSRKKIAVCYVLHDSTEWKPYVTRCMYIAQTRISTPGWVCWIKFRLNCTKHSTLKLKSIK